MSICRTVRLASVLGMLALSVGCGGSSGVGSGPLPASDPASGNPDVMSGGDSGRVGPAGGEGVGGPGMVNDGDITPASDTSDPTTGGNP